MDWDTNLYTRCAQLQRKCTALQADCDLLRSVCTRISAHAHTEAPTSDQMPHTSPPTWPAEDPHGAALEVLRVIRALIDPFALEWQVAIVKALTARTIFIARERTRTPPPQVLSA